MREFLWYCRELKDAFWHERWVIIAACIIMSLLGGLD